MFVYMKYFTKKAGWYLLTLLIAVSLNFFLPRMIPGNPVEIIINKMITGKTDTSEFKKVYEAFSKEFGIDKPLHEQFIMYVGNLFQGDLGTSFSQYPRKVTDIMGKSVPWTLMLQFPAILIGWLIGNMLGAFSAYKKGIFDKVVIPVSLLVSAVPFFAFSIILQFIFAILLGWFPPNGGYDQMVIPGFDLDFISSAITHYILPFLSIVLVTIGGQAMGMREMSIYELNSDYVLYSKLSGVKDSKIIKYVFKNAMLPQITGLALSMGTMIGGALITEIVFNYPGIGTSLFTALRNLDYPLISGCTLLVTSTVLLANFLIEVVYGLVDPRIKAAQMEEN